MNTKFARPCVALHVALVCWSARRDDAGQTTAEYALVLLGAAAVALLVLAWAAKTNRVGRLLNAVMDSVIGKIT
jgi:hypothetical protein